MIAQWSFRLLVGSATLFNVGLIGPASVLGGVGSLLAGVVVALLIYHTINSGRRQ
jgi:ABC-type xylose transport system permease subunit